MRSVFMIALALFLSIGVAWFAGCGPSPTSVGHDSPRADYEKWNAAETAIVAERKALESLESRIRRADEALENYRTVETGNAETIARLERWAAHAETP